MRVIIAGGRDFDDYDRIEQVMPQLFNDDPNSKPDWRGFVILSGMARGADRLGLRWAEEHAAYQCYPADWDTHGKVAGFIRNEEMARNADVLVAFWDGKSRGTKHMIDTALKHGLEVHVYRY